MRAALIGYYGRGNLGDELMLICICQWLRQQGIDVTVIADDASVVSQQHGLPAVQNYPFLGQFSWFEAIVRGRALKTLAALFRCDLIICGGGDVIRDGVGWRTFTFQVEKLVAGVILRKPLYLLNVGLTQPVTRYGRATLKWLLPRCQAIVVRDARSMEICSSNAAACHLALWPDIVRRLPILIPAAAVTSNQARRSMLVALHGDPNVYGRYKMTPSRLATLAGLLDSVVDKHNLDIEFFPFQPEQDGGDAIMARNVQAQMRFATRTKILDWTIDVSAIAARFNRSSFVLAMRLHAAVLAATYGVPCILMPYDQKVLEFGMQAQIPYCLEPEMLDQLVLSQHFLEQALANPIISPALDPVADWLTGTLKSL